MQVQHIKIEEYDYDLPVERIANFPLKERDASKLLVYKNNAIAETIYKNITDYLPENALLIFNNTKVINARLLFTKDSGATIEVFVLEPHNRSMTEAMQTTQSILVKCFIGGASKWKQGMALQKNMLVNTIPTTVTATIVGKESDNYLVQLQWNTAVVFSQVIEAAGNVPLPPYIKRVVEKEDAERYQTIYAANNGSVAAPTAGLHFTPTIFQSFTTKNITPAYVTLHVGAGTFKPVTSAVMKAHHMHSEYMEVSIALIKKIIEHTAPIIGVGTTSVRTIESLYWLGVKVATNPNIAIEELTIQQWDAYMLPTVTKEEALIELIKFMLANQLSHITTTTQLMIAPGYTYKIINAMVTNFHQPKSTLLLLVAAATNGKWKELYNYASQNDFRFLSYGDGCLIFLDK